MGQPVVHFEISGQDPEKLRSYYGNLFGWAFDTNAPVSEGVSQPGNYGFVDRNTTSDGVGIPSKGPGNRPRGWSLHGPRGPLDRRSWASVASVRGEIENATAVERRNAEGRGRMFHYLLPLPRNISHIEAFEPEALGEPGVSASPQGGRSPARDGKRNLDSIRLPL